MKQFTKIHHHHRMDVDTIIHNDNTSCTKLMSKKYFLNIWTFTSLSTNIENSEPNGSTVFGVVVRVDHGWKEIVQ